jgi:hypothetical protein
MLWKPHRRDQLTWLGCPASSGFALKILQLPGQGPNIDISIPLQGLSNVCKESNPFQAKLNNTFVYSLNSKGTSRYDGSKR